MPVYLCKPGCWQQEPWRHGIQVYEQPFPLDTDTRQDDVFVASTEGIRSRHERRSMRAAGSLGRPVRKVRHAEVVLVDDVSIAYDRYWLRLRWPGPQGAFAGYIALGGRLQWDKILKHSPVPFGHVRLPSDEALNDEPEEEEEEEETEGEPPAVDTGDTNTGEASSPENREDQNSRETREEPTIGESEPSGPVKDETSDNLAPRCSRTGLYYPSSSAMELLTGYDDGLHLKSFAHNDTLSPVFCRICREGLHDVSEDESPQKQEHKNDGSSHAISIPAFAPRISLQDEDNETDQTPTYAPEQPHPTYKDMSVLAENPLLAPCECSGSMAFVHYLCVEQWRCRSRHPDARNGLHCETCGGAYALPPPSSRPPPHEGEWLDAMPPQILDALRRPHPWWQIGTAMVRSKWLRPVAPVLLSPTVALYCRARRLLKKRGVSRRRWACSLCRRRARWKCVRCLRSYYCSRQCQNVSWHIVHKYICYKPSRFWWSVAVYGAGTILLLPGILRDPMIYDLALSLIPISFLVTAIIGGGTASMVKKGFGVDLRGRTLESVVVLLTVFLVFISWGVVWAFFGDTDQCWGAFGPMSAGWQNGMWFKWLSLMDSFLLKPAKKWFLLCDKLALTSNRWISGSICTVDDDSEVEGCFPFLKLADSDFYHDESCASDVLSVTVIWTAAAWVSITTSLFKRRGGLRRPQRAHED